MGRNTAHAGVDAEQVGRIVAAAITDLMGRHPALPHETVRSAVYQVAVELVSVAAVPTSLPDLVRRRADARLCAWDNRPVAIRPSLPRRPAALTP